MFYTFKGSLSHVLQQYAKSVMHRKLEPVPEEKEMESEPVPTSPSQVQQEDLAGSPTEDKNSLLPPKAHNKPTVDSVLKKIKPQVPILF